MVERHYSSTAVETELSSGVDDSTGSMSVDSVTGYPVEFPFTIVVDPDTASEELCDVTDATGTTLTVTRGVDGTVGLSHEAGAVVKHTMSGRDLQNSRDHEEDSTGVHGIGAGSSVVGTETTQTLINKTLDGDDNTFQDIPQSAVTDLVTDQATQDGRLTTNEGNISSLTTSLSNHEASSSVHGVGEVAGLTEAQTLTNKTIDDSTIGGSNNVAASAITGMGLRAIDSGSINIQFTGSSNTATNTANFAAGRFSGTPHVVAMIVAVSGANTTSPTYLLTLNYGSGGSLGGSLDSDGVQFEARRHQDATGTTVVTVHWIAVEML